MLKFGFGFVAGSLIEIATPIKVDSLQKAMESVEIEESHKKFLLEGFTQGFRIHFEGDRELVYDMDNHMGSGTQDSESIMWEKIMKEVRLGRVAGPFEEPPLPNFRVSPLGVVPKGDSDFRMIFDLSLPKGVSVNDGIPKEAKTVQYTDYLTLVRAVDILGQGTYMAKTDLKSAFRQIPIHPDDRHLLGMRVKGFYFVDKVLPFGLATSCRIFESFTSVLNLIMQARIPPEVYLGYYIDDYMHFSPVYQKCLESLAVFESTCLEVGFPVAPEKTEGPSTQIVLLGIGVDSVRRELFIPTAKRDKAAELIVGVLVRKKVWAKTLQRLAGILNFLLRAVYPGRPFLRRLYDTIGEKYGRFNLPVNSDLRLDLKVWQEFLTAEFTRVSFLDLNKSTSQTLEWFTDAAGSAELGLGAVFGSRWMSLAWSECDFDQTRTPSIAYLELAAVVVSVWTWGELIKNSRVQLWCDNMSVVQVVNTLTSKDRDVMDLLRMLVRKLLELNIKVSMRHVPGVENIKADMLSRLQEQKFRERFGQEMDVNQDRPNSRIWPLSNKRH